MSVILLLLLQQRKKYRRQDKYRHTGKKIPKLEMPILQLSPIPDIGNFNSIVYQLGYIVISNCSTGGLQDLPWIS